MDIKCVVTGYLDENCYILSKNGKCLVIDPGDDYIKIKEAIGDNQVLGVLITHSDNIAPASISVLLSFFLVGERTESLTITKAKMIKGININDIKVNL